VDLQQGLQGRLRVSAIIFAAVFFVSLASCGLQVHDLNILWFLLASDVIGVITTVADRHYPEDACSDMRDSMIGFWYDSRAKVAMIVALIGPESG